MSTLIRFSIIILFLVSGLQAVTAQTSPTRLRLKQLELAPDSTEHVITSDSNRVAVWTKKDSLFFGTISGALTPGRIPRATGTYTLGDGVLRDDGTLLALGGVTVAGYSFYDYSTGGWRLATGTTAQRPTNVAGVHRYNTTLGFSETGNGSVWLQSDFPAGTDTYTLRYVNSTGKWDASSLLKNTGSVIQVNTSNTARTFNVGGNMFLADGNSNTFINSSTSLNPTGGNHNIVVGFQSGYSLTNGGEQNIIMGRGAGQLMATGDNNVFLGSSAGNKATGLGNVAIGLDSYLGGVTNTGNYNTCLGYRSGYLLTSGSFNTLDGAWAGGNISTGGYNTIFGWTAGSGIQGGSSNTAIGYEAGGLSIGNGSFNVALGTRGLYDENDSSPSYAIGIGYETGYLATEVDNCVFLGRSAGAANSYSNVVVIGYGSTASQNAQIAIGTGINYSQLKSRNYAFNIDQTVGAGQDGYALKYNNSTGEIELAADATGGTMSSFTLAGSSGTPQTVTNAETATIEQGWGVTTVAAATDKVTVAADSTKVATQYDLTQVATLYTGDGTIATDRTVTIAQDSTLKFQGASAAFPGANLFSKTGYNSDWGGYGFYERVYTDDYRITQFALIQDADSTAYYYVNATDRNTFDAAILTLQPDGQAGITGLNGSGSAGLRIITSNDAGGYGPRINGTAGNEFDTGSGGKHVFQINNTTEAVIDATGLGINDTSPEKSLDVGGMGKFRQLSGQDNSVTIGTNANAGTGRSASITDAQSSDVAGRISFTSGTTLTAGEWVTLTWGASFDNAPAVQLFPENANAASITPYLYVVPSTTGCSIVVNVTGGAYEGLTFEFNYITVQGK